MAKIFIEETTLTAIGDAIRGKEGTTELVPVNDIAARISAIQTGSDPIIEALEITSNGTYTATDCDGYSPITVNVPQEGGPPEEAFTITGNCSYRLAYDGWSWFIAQHGGKITTKDINNCNYMFYSSKSLSEIPFTINTTSATTYFDSTFSTCQQLKECPKIRGANSGTANASFSGMLMDCHNLRDLNDLFEPEFLDFWGKIKVTSAYSVPKPMNFSGCYSLRSVPTWWYKLKLNPESTAFPSTTYAIYRNTFDGCHTLDEAKNIPVLACAGAATSNMFTTSTFSSNYRLKSITFETDNGQPIIAKWKAQTIDLNRTVGYTTASIKSYILNYNSGISADKEVTDDATYQALKNDPDWFTCNVAYSRYNHDSAVETINSLPDTSAYLATAGGTNTIQFLGKSGSATDGGAINTLTAEEIAVATAKGWTVTLV